MGFARLCSDSQIMPQLSSIAFSERCVPMKITMAQLNPTIGDFAGNLAKIEQALQATAGSAPDLVVFPELFLTGYPPRDLLERNWFIRQTQEAIDQVCAISRAYPETGILLGAPRPTGRAAGKGL